MIAHVSDNIKARYTDESPHPYPLITEDDLAALPTPVQRYLRYTGVIGKPRIETVRLQYTGEFRMAANKPWMPMKATQIYTTNPPGFQWTASFKMGGFPLMYGKDTYKNGQGHMFGKLIGLFTIFDVTGEEMIQGSMLRYLQEMIWFPSAFLNDYIRWQAVDDHCAEVTFTDSDHSVTARLIFDDAGRLITFIAQRYREDKGRYLLDTWSTPMTEYGRLAGLNLPVVGCGVWQLAGGDLAYIKLHLNEVVYNEAIEDF